MIFGATPDDFAGVTTQRRITNMENKKKRFSIMVIGFVVLIGFLVIDLPNNKFLSGVSSGAASDSESTSGGSSVAAIWESMWRDGRKYGVFLHLLAQTVSKIPQGIFSSCANLFAFQTKDAKDRDMILPHLGKSEKGMVNTEYKRYLARIPKTYAIVKLGYSADVYDIEPVLIQLRSFHCVEPSDGDIVRVLRAGDVG
jgi:DNA helicase HerA-like ATPase